MILSAGSIIARASSGSRSCINSVEPLMSANSAVTVLRSPSSFSGSGASLTRTVGVSNFFAAAAAGPPSAAPHSPQKRLPAGLSAPHFGQRFASGAPQSPQNFLPAGFSALQLEQRMPVPKSDPLLVYHPAPWRDQHVAGERSQYVPSPCKAVGDSLEEDVGGCAGRAA